MKFLLLFLFPFVLTCLGCATNPVTGQTELQLISTQQEIAIGQQAYPQQLQASGGAYDLDTDLQAYVARVGRKLVEASDRPSLPYEFTVVNDGTWNAWALPGGKIGIHRGLLLAMRNESELAAVLAHEIVHAAARHSAKQMERGLVFQVGLIGASEAVDEDYRDTTLIAGSVAVGLGMLKYSRDAESEADFYGIRTMVRAGYDPMGAVTLQELFAENQNNAGGWLATHPASVKRVRQNREALGEYAQGGLTGETTYGQSLARLRSWGPAYDAYDRGVKALIEQNDPAKALEFAGEAVEILPKEALFHGLRARGLDAKGDPQGAMDAWNRAVDLNPDWFYFTLERGLLNERMGRKDAARRDVKRSYDLLPTDKAQSALNRLGVREK
jgi:predicted Zn-dependent protease